MRTNFLLCLAFLFTINHFAFAQSPQGINYQGVARSTDGQPLSSKEISIRISILEASANGNIEYDEIHEVRTNSFGLFTLVIGQGASTSSPFNFINWTSGKKWLQVEMDENGGRNFKLMGSQQLMSVPYALYAERAGNGYQAGSGIAINNNMITNLGDGDHDSTNELISEVTLGSDNKLRITDAGGVKEADLSSLIGAYQNLNNVLTQGNSAGNSTITNLGTPVNSSDAVTKLYVDNLETADGDKSATNEIQTLSKAGNSILLSAGGGTVVLNDDSPTNEIQTISAQTVDANTRSLALSSGNTINVDIQDGDASNTNEAQTLSRTGSDVTLTPILGTGGGTVSINDADASPTNEAQTLSKSGATVTLTNVSGAGGGSFIINDDSNTNEAQTISKTGSNVTLTQANGAGGGSFSINDADADPSNELQNLTQVLARGTDAGGNRITNLSNPSATQDATTKNYVDTQDAILSSMISTNYAFKATFDYQNVSGIIVSNQIMPVVAEDFDDFNVLGSTGFTAAEAGTYVFVVDGYYNTLSAGGSLSLLYNSVKHPITIVQPFGATQPRFSATFMFKLSVGQTVQLVGDNIALLGQFNGKFFGYKL
ncbi:MAG: hypothetical protein ABJH04_04150 [Cyclobacteriaceae bacterium]